jgi:hypothetical protein
LPFTLLTTETNGFGCIGAFPLLSSTVLFPLLFFLLLPFDFLLFFVSTTSILGVVTDFDFAVTSVKSESRSKVSGFISSTEVCCGGGSGAVVVADGAVDVEEEVEGRVDGIGRGREGGRVEEGGENERAEEGGEGGRALTCAT